MLRTFHYIANSAYLSGVSEISPKGSNGAFCVADEFSSVGASKLANGSSLLGAGAKGSKLLLLLFQDIFKSTKYLHGTAYREVLTLDCKD